MKALLKNSNIPLWDYVILTSSNEQQAEAYQGTASFPYAGQCMQ